MKQFLLSALLLGALSARAQFKAPLERPATATNKQVNPDSITRLLAERIRVIGVTPSASAKPGLRGFQTQSAIRTEPAPVQPSIISVPLALRRAAPDVRSVNSPGNQRTQALGSLELNSAVQRQLSAMSLPLKQVAEELAIANVSTDAQGIRHVRMEQRLRGVPVYGAEVVLHQPSVGAATATGRVAPTAKGLKLTPALSQADAKDLMHAALPSPAKYAAGSLAEELLATTAAPELNIYELAGRPHLAYVGDVSPRIGEHYRVVVDAASGEVIDRWSIRCDAFTHVHPAALPPPGGETARARDVNGVTRTIQTYADQGTFWLIDGTRPMWQASSGIPDKVNGGIVTIDAQNTAPQSDDFAAVYASDDANRWDDPRAVSAHYNSEQAFEYFRTTFDRNSIDGRGGNIRAVVNVADEDGGGLDNAFWYNGIMWYGNGKESVSALAGALDVGGHEMTHGVIENTANLEYKGESGAINEHFADVFAVMIDRDDWRLGEDIVSREYYPTGALRDFSDPANGGNVRGNNGYQPPTYAERYTGSEDNGGVHINSGMLNNVCYRIAQTLGREATEQLYYSVLTDYLTRGSEFIDYRNALQQRGEQLYGAGSGELVAIVAALDAVGIPGSADGGGGDDGPVTQTTNPGDELIAVLDEDETLVRIIGADGAVVIEDITPSYVPAQRPSITDDGSLGLIVTQDGDINLVGIDYQTNTVSENPIAFDLDNDGKGDLANAIISRDGSRLAYILGGDFRDDKIYVGDLSDPDSKTEEFRLYVPSSDGDPIYSVESADAMEFDYTGEYLIYDAFTSVRGADGFDVESWDISVAHVFDNGTRTFADGRIDRLFGVLDEGVNIGNPTLAKNSADILAFDYFDGDDNYAVRTVNVQTGDQGTLFSGTKIGFPTYAPDDKTVYFSADTENGDPVIARIPLEADKLTGVGDATALAADASRSTAFANGERVIVGGINELRAGAAWTLAPNPTADVVRIFRMAGAPAETERFELFDVRGVLIASYAPQVKQIDLSGMPAGSYVLRQSELSQVLVRR